MQWHLVLRFMFVLHRIDDLETMYNMILSGGIVLHRIDDLEISR